MDFEWVAIALGDVAWISVAFALGFLARSVGLPPLVGFLATGFLLNGQGITSGQMLDKMSDLGITLLLFTVGLKLNVRTLVRPQVWAVTGIHTSVFVALFGFGVYGLAIAGLPFVSDLTFRQSFIVAFALSFSSTVFTVKVLEEKGEMASLHGRIAIGILIMQDIAAVVFLAASSGKWPSLWALSVVLLIPLRPLLHRLLVRVGHGELLILYGFMLALGGAEVFELVGLKGDLGALVIGVMIAGHPKSEEMAKTMLGFKDLFLLGFFLSIGLSSSVTFESLEVGASLVPLALLKSVMFFALLAYFRLRSRTALLASLALCHYSEFGLIVAAIAVANDWLNSEWLVVISICLSLSFAVAAVLNAAAIDLYSRYRPVWRRLQRVERLADDKLLDLGGASIAIIGMGGVGTGTYDKMREIYGETVVGVDIDPITVSKQRATGRNVLLGDPSDADFWDRVYEAHTLKEVLLALPKFTTTIAVLEQLKEASFSGRVAVTARFADEVEPLKSAGATTVFNIYTEAGVGFATHVAAEWNGRS